MVQNLFNTFSPGMDIHKKPGPNLEGDHGGLVDGKDPRLRKLPLEVAVSLLVRLEGRQDLQQPG
jgi:hypothetical protein